MICVLLRIGLKLIAIMLFSYLLILSSATPYSLKTIIEIGDVKISEESELESAEIKDEAKVRPDKLIYTRKVINSHGFVYSVHNISKEYTITNYIKSEGNLTSETVFNLTSCVPCSMFQSLFAEEFIESSLSTIEGDDKLCTYFTSYGISNLTKILTLTHSFVLDVLVNSKGVRTGAVISASNSSSVSEHQVGIMEGTFIGSMYGEVGSNVFTYIEYNFTEIPAFYSPSNQGEPSKTISINITSMDYKIENFVNLSKNINYKLWSYFNGSTVVEHKISGNNSCAHYMQIVRTGVVTAQTLEECVTPCCPGQLIFESQGPEILVQYFKGEGTIDSQQTVVAGKQIIGQQRFSVIGDIKAGDYALEPYNILIDLTGETKYINGTILVEIDR